jgi:hypothetical protein
VLMITWAPAHHAEWDADARHYVDAGIVAPGKSRRLARLADPQRAFKGYVGVQCADPHLFAIADDQVARFFVSVFAHGRTITLRTFPTIAEALALAQTMHARLPVIVAK